jgi:DNA-binding IclR family transcriptional regulator
MPTSGKRAQGTRPRPARSAQVSKPAANSTADRAIDILLMFSEERPILTVAEISAHFGMPRTTTYRYLNSLRSYALIEEEPSGGCRLGPRIFPLARIAKDSSSLQRISLPHLNTLNRQFGESVILYERIGHELIAVHRCECLHRVSINYFRGQLLPWPATASAKVLLAYASESDRRGILKLLKPVRYTETTIANIKSLRAYLDTIVKKGYAYSDQERDRGVRGISAPIFSRGEAHYCLTMSGPTFRITEEKLPIMISAVKRTAEAISDELRNVDF